MKATCFFMMGVAYGRAKLDSGHEMGKLLQTHNAMQIYTTEMSDEFKKYLRKALFFRRGDDLIKF